MRQKEAEQRSLDAIAIASEYRQAIQARALQVSEPSVYTRESPWSFFQDILRVGRGYGGRDHLSAEAARTRLDKHAREVAAGEEARKAADTRARHAIENALSATSAEARALERFLATGYTLFETRALSRTDSKAGTLPCPSGWFPTSCPRHGLVSHSRTSGGNSRFHAASRRSTSRKWSPDQLRRSRPTWDLAAAVTSPMRSFPCRRSARSGRRTWRWPGSSSTRSRPQTPSSCPTSPLILRPSWTRSCCWATAAAAAPAAS